MKVIPTNKGLLIEPETDFEEDYLDRLGWDDLIAYVKHGMSGSEVLGLVIKVNKEEEAPK